MSSEPTQYLVARLRDALAHDDRVAALDIQAMGKANTFLTIETRDSKPYTAFRGIPIRICDQITNNEPNVT